MSCYEHGQGLHQDYATALSWYRKAAEQGYARAQTNLGIAYADGRGVKKNFAWAVYWEASATRQGDSNAAHNLASDVKHLTRYRVTRSIINVRAKATTASQILTKIKAGTIVYRLDDLSNGWYEVYLPDGYTDGYIAKPLLAEVGAGARGGSSGPFPPPPAPRPSYTTCSTRCFNGDCYRTYSSGQHTHFQASRRFNPVSQQWEFDSGGC